VPRPRRCRAIARRGLPNPGLSRLPAFDRATMREVALRVACPSVSAGILWHRRCAATSTPMLRPTPAVQPSVSGGGPGHDLYLTRRIGRCIHAEEPNRPDSCPRTVRADHGPIVSCPAAPILFTPRDEEKTCHDRPCLPQRHLWPCEPMALPEQACGRWASDGHRCERTARA